MTTTKFTRAQVALLLKVCFRDDAGTIVFVRGADLLMAERLESAKLVTGGRYPHITEAGRAALAEAEKAE